MKNLPLLIATIVGTFALVIGVAVFFSTPEEASTPEDPSLVVGQRALEELSQNQLEGTENSKVLGDEATGSIEISDISLTTEPTTETEDTKEAKEKATIVVFSDFQCPACKSLEESVLIRTRLAYSDRINLVFRHFPLDSIHQYARQAAWASEAARDEGKFWEYHDLLFKNQATWASLKSKDEVREAFIEYATELEIDKDKFIEKMESEEVKQRVNADSVDGNSLKINSTPTIYLNNNKTAPQDLSKQIELLLNKN